MNLRNLQPRRLQLEWQRFSTKWSKKLRGLDRQVLTLPPTPSSTRPSTLPPGGESRGAVLVSYVLDGVRQALAGRVEHSHTHFWEAHRIAQTFADLGFEVDVVHWQNQSFEPTKPYRAVVDVRSNLERWAPTLPDDCIKIFHGETAHWSFHRDAQAERYDALEARRDVRLPPVKPAEPNRGIETADVGFILGNDFTLGTFEPAGTPLHRLWISSNTIYPDLEREAESAKRFLWFGSGDLVHKGLDLVLEAVARRPDLELVVCGPIHREPHFERAYARELYELPNVETYGWIDTESRDFLDIARRCSALIYPSCSEGQCGGVVTCMHAGLVPILTEQCGLDVDPAFGTLLPDPLMRGGDPVEPVESALEAHATRPWSETVAMSRTAAEVARTEHTRERFAARYRELAANALGVAREHTEPTT